MKKEIRFFPVEDLKVEERQSDSVGPKISGYAAVFNRWSEDLGGFRERIKPGAFKKALKNSDVRGLFNHDSNYILGRQSNGTLRLNEDKKGLWMEIDPPDTQLIRDMVLAPIKRGDISQQSFGFIVAKDGDDWKGLDGDDKEPISRTITEVKELFDVSPVTFPAYPDTSVALRRLEQAQESTFKVADESDILNVELMKYLESDSAELRQIAAFNIVESLFPQLTDEQRKSFAPELKTDGKSPADGDGHNDAVKVDEKTPDLTQQILEAEERYQIINNRLFRS